MIEILQKIGFTKNEAKVYFAFLELGEGSILQAAKRARLNRSIIHVVTEKLVKSGFLIEGIKGVKRVISARSPDHLRENLKRAQRELRKKELKFEEYLPELRRMHRHESLEYRVNILDGHKGIETWCDLILETAQTEMLEIVKIEELVPKINKYLKNIYFPKKAEIGLPTRFLFVDTPYARKYVEDVYVKETTAAPLLCKFIPDDPNIMHGYKVVWNDNLSFYSSRENKVTILRDQNIANHERSLFDALWNDSGESFTNCSNQNWKDVVSNFKQQRN